MIKISKNNFITVLDLGTNKTTLFIARLNKDSSFSILGSSLVNTRGMEKGGVVDLGKVSDTIAEVVKEAEEKSKLRTASLFTNISSSDLRGQKIKASVPISDKPSQITLNDLKRVKEAAKNIAVPFDREVIHMITQNYAVDGQSDITNPLGLSGTHLEGNFYLITVSLSSLKNIIQAVNNVGLNVSGVIFSGLALAHGILTEEEKNDGVVLLDFGAGTTKAIIFIKNQLKAVEIIPLGGDDLTKALSNNLRLPTRNAEGLKRRYSGTMSNSSLEDKIIFNEEGKFHSISRKQFNQILNKEWLSILGQVVEKVKKSVNFNQVTSGIVVSGGSVLIDGSIEKIENIFSLPVRLGAIKDISEEDIARVHNPIYATSYSLIQYAVQNYRLTPPELPTPKNLWNKAVAQTKELLQDYF